METACFGVGPGTLVERRVRGAWRGVNVPATLPLHAAKRWHRVVAPLAIAKRVLELDQFDRAASRLTAKGRGPHPLRAASLTPGGTSDNFLDRFLSGLRPGSTAEPEAPETRPAEVPSPPAAAAAAPLEAASPPMAATPTVAASSQAPAEAAVGNAVYKATAGIGMDQALENNRKWARAVTMAEPDYFSKLAQQQTPEFLWIGCADSRVPANQILGLAPGEVFVHRNVGNLATHKDMNAMACLEFSVDVLKVKHIIICGHYNCGAVKGALTLPAKEKGLVNLWISDIRDVRNRHETTLKTMEGMQAKWDRLCELNVVRQMFNVCTSPIVQAAWDRGQPIAVHSYVYSLSDGLLKEVAPTVSGIADLTPPKDDSPSALLNRAFSTFSYFEGEASRSFESEDDH